MMACTEVANIHREMLSGSRRPTEGSKGAGGPGMELWEPAVCAEEDGLPQQSLQDETMGNSKAGFVSIEILNSGQLFFSS